VHCPTLFTSCVSRSCKYIYKPRVVVIVYGIITSGEERAVFRSRGIDDSRIPLHKTKCSNREKFDTPTMIVFLRNIHLLYVQDIIRRTTLLLDIFNCLARLPPKTKTIIII